MTIGGIPIAQCSPGDLRHLPGDAGTMSLNFTGGYPQKSYLSQELIAKRFQIKMSQALTLCSEITGITEHNKYDDSKCCDSMM